MKSPAVKSSRWVGALAIIAVVFGLLTIISGGRTSHRTVSDSGDFPREFSLSTPIAWMNSAANQSIVGEFHAHLHRRERFRSTVCPWNIG